MSNWNSEAAIDILEKGIYQAARAKWKTSSLWTKIHTNDNPVFAIKVLPVDGTLRLHLECGSIPLLYIRGLNLFGGNGRLDEPAFWNMLEDMLYLVPKCIFKSDLDRPSSLVTHDSTNLKKYKREPFQQDSSDILKELVPIANTKILSAKLVIEGEERSTGLKVTFEMNAIPLPYEDDVIKATRVRLTQMLYEAENTMEEG